MTVREDEKITQEAKHALESWRNYFSHNITQYHDFYEFVMGQQWTDDELKLFRDYKKIPICMNKLKTLIKTLSGEQIQNTPNLQVYPAQNANVQTAEIREAIVKRVAFHSRSKMHYQNAFKQGSIGGFSALKVGTDYENPYSFNQDLIIGGFRDPTHVFFDETALDEDKTDGMFCGDSTFMSRTKFKSIYGEELESKIADESSNDVSFTYANENGITIINYYVKEIKKIDLVELDNGEIVEKSELKKVDDVELEFQGIDLDYIDLEGDFYSYNNDLVSIVREREAERYTIKYYKIAGSYVLEETEFPAERLPYVFVDSDSWFDKNGRQMCTPFVADAKDAQKYINYLATQSVYVLKNSRYDQFLVSKENVRGKDTKEIWDDPSTQNGGLYFDKDRDGFVPQQLAPPELPSSFTHQYERAMMDIYTGTGMYAARLGDQGNEESGKAINARRRQGSYSTTVNFDALNRAITTIGAIVNDSISRVYDVERVMSLELPDVGEREVVLNQAIDEYGQQIQNDMTKGTYQVTLKAGASFEGQKQEALESMQQVLQANPQVFELIADLYVENLPLSNNLELRNRLRTIVPPEIIEAGKTGQPIPRNNEENPEAQAAQMQLQLKARELDLKEQEMQLKAQKQTQDIEMEIEKIQNERAQIVAQMQEQKMRYNAEMHRTMSDKDIARANNITDILTHKIQ